MTSAKPLLSLENVSKSFGGVQAVRDVSLSVDEGEICGVVGPNGAGKSTLFNIIAGSILPTKGSIQVGGRDVTWAPSFEVARLGVARAFQLMNLFESMTVFENVMVGADRHDKLRFLQSISHLAGFRRDERAAEARADWAMEIVGVERLADVPVPELSLGQQKLVGVARAMAAQPRLLLLDEPASGLSDLEMRELREAIVRVRSAGAAIVLIEHNVNFVMSVVDKLMVLQFGEAIAYGSPSEIRRSESVIEAYIGKR